MFVTAILLGYAWIGYPILLVMFAAMKRQPVAPREASLGITCADIILSAHNEEKCISDRIENLLLTARKLEAKGIKTRIYIGTDGCSDTTADIIRAFAARNECLKLFDYPANRGKVAVLKDLIRESAPASRTHDADMSRAIIFTDANTFFADNALEKLLAHFTDPRTGGVCGRLVFVQPDASPAFIMEQQACAHGDKSPENRYWRWETGLKERESRLDSCLGANGAIYAIRRELFPSGIPDNTIVDDFVIGMNIREQGFKMVYEPAAIACEQLPVKVEHEWRRRVRIGAGDYQALVLCRRCLLPGFGWFAWIFWSHKVLRWFTPHLGVVLICAAIASLAAGPAVPVAIMGSLVLGMGMLTALFSLAGLLIKDLTGSGGGIFKHAHYFLVIQTALLAGFLRFCKGDLRGRWERTPR